MQNFTIQNLSKTIFVSIRANSISDACREVWNTSLATKSSKLIEKQIDGQGGTLRVVRAELHTRKELS